MTVIYHSSYCIHPPYQTSDSAVFSAVRNVAVVTPLTHHMDMARWSGVAGPSQAGWGGWGRRVAMAE